jgi:hypothetical protein
MSDFFRNLASRIGAHESPVRPRIAGRYELPASNEQFIEVVEEIERSENDASMIGAPLRWPVSAPQSRTSSEDRTEQGGTGSAHQAPDVLPEPITANPLVADPSKPSVSDERPHDQDSRQPIYPEDHRHAPREERSAAPEPSAPGQAAPRAELPAKTQRTELPPSLVATPVPPTAPAAPTRERVGTPRSRQSAREASPTETIVHVSIGRIELRAPQPTAPPKRDQPPSPVSTLAEYLNQHAARSRP